MLNAASRRRKQSSHFHHREREQRGAHAASVTSGIAQGTLPAAAPSGRTRGVSVTRSPLHTRDGGDAAHIHPKILKLTEVVKKKNPNEPNRMKKSNLGEEKVKRFSLWGYANSPPVVAFQKWVSTFRSQLSLRHESCLQGSSGLNICPLRVLISPHRPMACVA